ncbi:hypothetical protein H6F42_08410 [Pseudanabaena sp. FACHB-1998]|uniref:methyl-accepting chemotaxis protein n=1 Tax=Pseudanabaena sp. FACHB-1998 TaxID=2692858 RepID=UPI0016818155|nr:methyl-accepting chemotaxis protein [Pseudanabaena sp. FACHB-1998]MBD2176931.1 hypothetical protein [Pseudanabaena sp. FACHB-1998]
MMTAQYQAALHSYAEGRYEEAMQQFSELLYEDPRNPKLHIWLGATFRKAGKIEYAKVQYQQVLTLTDDPDLLDLASTSLAQIQNKLAAASQRTSSKKDIHKDVDNILTTSGQSFNTDTNSTSGASDAVSGTNQIITPNRDVTVEDLTLLTPSSPPNSTSKIKAPLNIQSNGNGVVPPPPAIASLIKTPPLEVYPEASTQLGEQTTDIVTLEELAENVNSTVLQDTIANIQKSNPKTKLPKKGKKTKKNNAQAQFPPVEAVLFGDRHGLEPVDRAFKNSPDASAISLEEMFKFSSVGQKITLWGALIATIPAITLGVAAYQVGDSLLLNRVKQGQQAEAIALAKSTGSFLQRQSADVQVLKTLLVSTEVGLSTLQNPANPVPSTNLPANKTTKPAPSLPIAQQRQLKQQLTNRLNLYGQAYPQYSSIAVFSANGELIAQSKNSQGLQTLSPNFLSKATTTDSTLISNSVATKEGAYIYAVSSIKSSVSNKVSMVLQVEIPVKSLVSELSSNTSSTSSFYVIDSSNRYVASSQTVNIAEDASADFSILSDLRAAQSPDLREVLKGDRTSQFLAYASVGNMQNYGMLPWDIVTTVDKSVVMAGNQNLLLVIGIGIASTPFLVGAIAYVLSRKLSSRLKDIRSALRDLKQAKSDTHLGTLSVEGNDELSDISLSINKMSEQFQMMMLKQEQEKERLQLQVVKLFKVLSKLAREEKQEVQESDLSDENILQLGKKVRGEMVQRNAEVESYRKQKEEIQFQLMQMLKDMQALADGDLTVTTTSVDGNFTNLAIFFDDVMRGLHNIVGQVKSSANQVNFSLGQSEQAIANLASVSQRQVDTVARSLNTAQMSTIAATKISNDSQRIVQSSQLVASKISESDRSIDAVMEKVSELQSTVSNTAKKIKNLGESSQKVAKAISTINEIAIKTNFLAINATLEASRSGEMGGGLAIVAEEVGELAARSVATTKEVERLLSSIQMETNEVMAAVESGSNQVAESNNLAIAARDNLQQIAEISQQIDELMSSIADATLSQVQTSEGVANLMKDISHIAKRTLASSSEVSKFLKSSKQYSGDLQQSLAHFKVR